MKKSIFKYIAVILGLQSMMACTPDDYTFYDNETIDVSTIGRVELVPNHHLVLADGHAQLDLRPMVFTKDSFQIPDQRVNEKWLEYESAGGTSISRYFSTTDQGLVGKTLTTRVKIKGTDIVSEPIEFQVVAPLDKKYEPEITIPIVFHIVQTNEEIESFGGIYSDERIGQLLMRLNNVFGGLGARNPVGVNAHIQFRFAEYDPSGKKMVSPGINRLTVNEIESKNNYIDFLVTQHLDWPGEKYLNIWLISDREKKIRNFGSSISALCQPGYVIPAVKSDIPGGLRLKEYTEGTEFSVKESGIIYRLQELDEINRTIVIPDEGTNDLIQYIGRYLGLMPTSTFFAAMGTTDYCEDTHFYFLYDLKKNKLINTGMYKNENGFYFRGENIMDDVTALHSCVSKNQCERIHWVLNNCPDRMVWKNTFAFTGE